MIYREWKISKLGDTDLLCATLGEEMIVLPTQKEVMDAIDELEDELFLEDEDWRYQHKNISSSDWP
jgi:hypothetical protein